MSNIQNLYTVLYCSVYRIIVNKFVEANLDLMIMIVTLGFNSQVISATLIQNCVSIFPVARFPFSSKFFPYIGIMRLH